MSIAGTNGVTRNNPIRTQWKYILKYLIPLMAKRIGIEFIWNSSLNNTDIGSSDYFISIGISHFMFDILEDYTIKQIDDVATLNEY